MYPMPNANPEYLFESIPLASSTLGSTMPQPMISSQPVPLQTLQPLPPQRLHDTSTSADGSVKGKYGGNFLQYGKVEICGVNTSKLKVLSEKEKRALLNTIKNGSEQERKKARDAMINGNLRLVLSVIQRFTNRGENPDDLFQVGVIGLIKAIDNFDPSLDVRFSTYGVPMIIGEVRRYLRDNNAIRVSRSMRDTAYKAMQIKEQLTNKENREPTVEEIAKIMGVPKHDVVLALEAIIEPVSLYEPVFSDGSDTIYVMDQIGDKSDDTTWLEEIAVKEAIANLSDREKRILTMRFFRGKTQMEVASEIGISGARKVAQIDNEPFAQHPPHRDRARQNAHDHHPAVISSSLI